jgi:hypothetical protein
MRLNLANAAGNVRGDSLRGVVSPGLNLFVSRSIGNAGGTTSTGDSQWLLSIQMLGHGMSHHASHCEQQFKATEPLTFFTTVTQQWLQSSDLVLAGTRPEINSNDR